MLFSYPRSLHSIQLDLGLRQALGQNKRAKLWGDSLAQWSKAQTCEN